jgi:RND family efflux transporter MFP subunit
MNTKSVFRFLATAAIFGVAIGIGIALWRHYMQSPWTRDGRVRADVINVAADVSGIVTSVAVHDDQSVKKGDLLFHIDAERYKLALAQAEATLAADRSELAQRRSEAARRAKLAGEVVTAENRDIAATQAESATAKVQAAIAARDIAQLNLDRTEVHAPADGYISNLDVHPGDYAVAGHAALALIDRNSFWVNGYFEETKLPKLHLGDAVDIRLMSGPRLRGHIASLSRGITDRDNATGQQLLANVNPTFSWVRLAQRVPVRIAIDQLPPEVDLVAGMTCTVVVQP